MNNEPKREQKKWRARLRYAFSIYFPGGRWQFLALNLALLAVLLSLLLILTQAG